MLWCHWGAKNNAKHINFDISIYDFFFFSVTALVYKSRTKKINYLQCSTIDFHETKNFFDICYWYRLTVLCSMRLISNNAEHKQSTDKIAIKSLIQIMSLISLSNICNKGTSGIRLILLWRKFYIISQSIQLLRYIRTTFEDVTKFWYTWAWPQKAWLGKSQAWTGSWLIGSIH